jgi:hypothetical protein
MTRTKDEALKLALDAQQIIASLCADKVIDSKEEKILRAATKQARSASPVQDPTDVWFDKCFRSDPPTAQPAPTVVDCHATGVCVQSGLRAERPAPVTLISREQRIALREAFAIISADLYFEANPANDNDVGRMLFERGFARGFDIHERAIETAKKGNT